jgi:hypothetical protein
MDAPAAVLAPVFPNRLSLHNSIFSAGQMVVQIPHDVQLSVTEISSHSYVHGKQPADVHQGMHQVRKKGRG